MSVKFRRLMFAMVVSIPLVLAIECDLSIDITDNMVQMNPGTSGTYIVTVSNNGPDTCDVIVYTHFPLQLQLASVVSSQGSCTDLTPCHVGNLTSGFTATMSIAYNVPINAVSSSAVTCRVIAQPVSPGAFDPNTCNNIARDTDVIGIARRGLGIYACQLSISISSSAFISANEQEFVVALTNYGPDPLTTPPWLIATINGAPYHLSPSNACTDFACHVPMVGVPIGSTYFQSIFVVYDGPGTAQFTAVVEVDCDSQCRFVTTGGIILPSGTE
jgi:hypothetical protein